MPKVAIRILALALLGVSGWGVVLSWHWFQAGALVQQWQRYESQWQQWPADEPWPAHQWQHAWDQAALWPQELWPAEQLRWQARLLHWQAGFAPDDGSRLQIWQQALAQQSQALAQQPRQVQWWAEKAGLLAGAAPLDPQRMAHALLQLHRLAPHRRQTRALFRTYGLPAWQDSPDYQQAVYQQWHADWQAHPRAFQQRLQAQQQWDWWCQWHRQQPLVAAEPTCEATRKDHG